MNWFLWYCSASVALAGGVLLSFAASDLAALMGYTEKDPKFGYATTVERHRGFGIGWYFAGAFLPIINLFTLYLLTYNWTFGRMSDETHEKLTALFRSDKEKKRIEEIRFVNQLIEDSFSFDYLPPSVADRTKSILLNCSSTDLSDGYRIEIMRDTRLRMHAPDGRLVLDREVTGLEAYLLRHYIVELAKQGV